VKMTRKTGKPTEVLLDAYERKCLGKTIDTCKLLAEWVNDGAALKAAEDLAELRAKYGPKPEPPAEASPSTTRRRGYAAT